MRSKNEYIESLYHMKIMMEPLFIYGNIREGALSLPEDVDSLPMDVIREGQKWLASVFYCEFKEAKRIWNMQAPEYWHRYRIWGDEFNDHREVILLKKAMKIVKKRVCSHDRPVLFKKTELAKIRRKK